MCIRDRIGPVALGHLGEWVREARAAVTWVSVLSNPIGDGADALIGIFEKNDKIQTLLGLEEGVQVLDLSKKHMDPGQTKILVAEIRLRRFTAALNSLTIDSIGVPFVNYAVKEYRDATGPRTYTLTVGKEMIDLSKKNLGLADVALVVAWLKQPEVRAAVEAIAVGALSLRHI